MVKIVFNKQGIRKIELTPCFKGFLTYQLSKKIMGFI